MLFGSSKNHRICERNHFVFAQMIHVCNLACAVICCRGHYLVTLVHTHTDYSPVWTSACVLGINGSMLAPLVCVCVCCSLVVRNLDWCERARVCV